jgi:type IV pilus assembly protein PilN
MIRINLLPVKQLKKINKAKNECLFLLVCIVILAVVLTSLGYGISHQITKKNAQITQLQATKRSFQKVLQKIRQLEQYKVSLENKLDTIKKLKQGSQLPVRVLDEIARLTPNERVWLTALKHKTGVLQVTGIALDNASIAQYMQKINGSKLLSSPDLSRTSTVKVADQNLKTFSLNIIVLNPFVVNTDLAQTTTK